MRHFLSIAVFTSATFCWVAESHDFQQAYLSRWSSKINKGLSRLSQARRLVVRHSVEELEAFNRGERSRRDYGAASIKVGSFFDWWCSEFAKSMITESGALSPEHPRWRELDRTGTTMQVISVYRKARAGFEREQLAHRIEVGDYLALGGPDSNKANHSTIVVYIDPQKRFLLTIDGNDSLNDEVRMHRRDYLIDAPTPRGEWKLTVNPYFYYLGKTDLLVRST